MALIRRINTYESCPEYPELFKLYKMFESRYGNRPQGPNCWILRTDLYLKTRFGNEVKDVGYILDLFRSGHWRVEKHKGIHYMTDINNCTGYRITDRIFYIAREWEYTIFHIDEDYRDISNYTLIGTINRKPKYLSESKDAKLKEYLAAEICQCDYSDLADVEKKDIDEFAFEIVQIILNAD